MGLGATRDLLRSFGLNNLEVDVYLTLVKHPGTTGYRIGSYISRPVANIYKALAQLEGKGLVVFSEASGSRVYLPVEFGEYVDKIESELRDKRDKIVSQLSNLSSPQKNFGSYNLTDQFQVYEKAKHLISTAKDMLLIDIFPNPYETLKSFIIDKESKGDADIRLKIYHEDEPICKNTISAYNGSFIVDNWIGHWLIVSKDMDECLIASFSKDSESILHAVWSTDPFICFNLFNGMANEFMLIDILNRVYLKKDIDAKKIMEINDQYNPLFQYEQAGGEMIMRKLFNNENS
ncbi:MAG: helix-turn-helix domain-containing protein [Candidatus Cloacimonetes bacterium]|nr:helix-turn-helix domain-containing protein [Candidatus Cloacimonadota bacterium]